MGYAPTVEMPQLSGGRRRAAALLAPFLDKLAGAVVTLDCRQLLAGTESFADELVREVLVDGHAALLKIQHADNEFLSYIWSAAGDHDVRQLIQA